MNNRGDHKLEVRDVREANRVTYGGDTITMQLSPGTIYMDIAVWSGPPSMDVPYAWFDDETPEVRIADFMRYPKPSWESDELARYHVRFLKWARSWDIGVMCRKPFEKKELAKAIEILSTIKFADTPIEWEEQAVEAAIANLQVHALPKREWRENCGCLFKHYDIDVQPLETGFRVSIVRLDGTEKKNEIGAHYFNVMSDGRVIVE